EYIVKGYAIDQRVKVKQLEDLKQTVKLLSNVMDNALVALTLMIAESRTEEKEIMVKVVVNLINRNNH
ncbi:MAG: hypothetical protein FWH59_04185, partial [Lentimicrobiaceae bacterium]|nr:hypothetical protein [Lentimicrobiaceae bacterium]